MMRHERSRDMSEQLHGTETPTNTLPADIKDWTEDQLEDSYFYLESLRPTELNAASMLNIVAELERRKTRSR